MKMRWAGDDKILRGATALDCLRYHCHGDHSAAAQRGDIDGVMARLSDDLQIDTSYRALPTLEERAAAFVHAARAQGWLMDVP